jgi:site-specific DNA recombinase
MLDAIKAGVVTPTTKAELERAEADHESAKAAMEAVSSLEEVLTTVLPNAAGRYRKLVGDLGRTLQTDTGHARQCLKTLLGIIRLVPAASGGFLEAEMRHSPEGLMRLALNNDEAFKVFLVAGVGFEPTTFRL